MAKTPKTETPEGAAQPAGKPPSAFTPDYLKGGDAAAEK